MKKKNYFLYVFTAFLGFINMINAQSDSTSTVGVVSRNFTTSSNLVPEPTFWSVNGNSGTTAGVNFIGTTDNVDVLFKRNNIISGRIGLSNTSYGFYSGQGGFANINIGRSAGSDSNHFLNFYNISIGENSGKSNTTGFENTFVGVGTGRLNTTGYGNTFIGSDSGKMNTIGYSNTALGYRALKLNNSGSDNVALSNGSLELNNDGDGNVAIGKWSLRGNVSGNYNIGIGYSAGSLSTGMSNVFLGEAAGMNLSNGNENIYLGYYTGHFLRSGSNNIFIGARSGYSTSQGSNNLFIGNGSGIGNGTKNIAIGENAGGKTGNGNILLGNNSSVNPDFQVNPLNDNILNIGNVIFGYNMNRKSSADNLSAKSGQIGINTTIPKNTLEVKSEAPNTSGLRFTNLTSAFNPTTIGSTNKFLSVDNNGDVVLQFMPNLVARNELTSQANTMTSTVNGVSSSASIVNSISNVFNANNQLITSVNGIASNPVTIPIPSFNEVDGSTTNELQTLSQSGNTITLSNGGGSFNLPTFTDTDAQSLTLTGNTLSISNGNSVVIPTTSVVGGTNVTVTGNGSTATPFLVSSIDTSLYANNGSINQATTINNNRVVNMNSRNIWFNTSSSTSNGNIYIGSSTSYPNTTGSYKLFVEGGILTEKVKVALRSTANWADYVFEKDYKLMPLNEVEKYISKNKHLPGVDSASDLSKNGLDLAEMQAKHMEKIEELTLYTIEQNKKIEQQEIEIKKTNRELEELKAQVKALIEKTK